MSITRTWRVCLLGIALCVAMTVCAHEFADRGGPRFMTAAIAAGIAYLLAMREFFASASMNRRVVIFGLVLAAVWHVELLRIPPGTDDDIRRYVWDGRLQRLGYNPYVVIPDSPEAKALHTAETRNLNNPELTSPYPAGAQLFFRAITAIAESAFAFKVAFVVCEIATAFVMFTALRGRHKEHMLLAFVWNPLLALEVAGSGHIDIVGTLLVVVSVAALLRGWRMSAAVALGLAISVKLLPIVLIPLYWKRVRLRDAAVAAAIIALLYVPFVNHDHVPSGSLSTYVQTFRFNGPIFAAMAQLVPPSWVAGVAVLSGLLTANRLRRSQPENWEAFAWPMAITLLFAPAVFPWYLLWLLPFLTSRATMPMLVWTIAVMSTYVVWHLSTLGHPFVLPVWVMLLEYTCVAIAAVMVLRPQTQRKCMDAAAVQ